MDNMEQMMEFLKSVDQACRFKVKRLNYMSKASVAKEILFLRDHFDEIWKREGDRFRLNNPDLSEKSIEILLGTLGSHREAEAILQAGRAIVSLDRVAFNEFLSRRVSNPRSVSNLFTIFYGDGGDTMAGLAAEQIPFLEQYIPTFRTIDTFLPAELSVTAAERDNIEVIIQLFDRIRDNFTRDIRLYRRFEKDFRRLYHESIALSILGYGEISTVMQIAKGNVIGRKYERERIEQSKWVWKRMPPFYSKEDVARFKEIYREYRLILTREIGLAVPSQTVRVFEGKERLTVYAGQERLNADFLCHRMIGRLDGDNATRLLLKILDELKKMHDFNKKGGKLLVGIDGQLSNWVLLSREGGLNAVGEDDALAYIDTSTPLYRKNGAEQLNAEIFLKNTPSFLRPLIRAFFLQEVLDRYYDTRSVIMDIIANLHKEKRPDLIPILLPAANRFMQVNGISDNPLTQKEIDKYYSGDAFIWITFQFSRRVDKFITEKIFRKKYTYRLPEKVDR